MLNTYNNKRLHLSLELKTPNVVLRSDTLRIHPTRTLEDFKEVTRKDKSFVADGLEKVVEKQRVKQRK